jgi:uncharacterized protein YggT (Ycf19 family)
MPGMEFAQYWYFHVPNFVLAAVIYTLLGRLALGLFAPEKWENYIWVAFKRMTDPFVLAVRTITPAVLGHHVVVIFTILWLMLLRIVFFAAMANLGLIPRAGG